MKIALVYPNYWPYVRRGVERMMHDLGTYLASANHEVHIITSKPGRSRTVKNGNLTVFYQSQVTHPIAATYRPLFRHFTFGFSSLGLLTRGNYDAAHMWAYPYGLALLAAQKLRKTPFVYHMIVNPPHWPARLDAWLFRRIFYAADRIAVLTHRDAARVEQEWGRESVVFPPPVDSSLFAPVVRKDLSRPRVLFASDLGDRRKGALLLLRAWDEIHRRLPDAILTLSGPTGIAGEPWTVDLLQYLPNAIQEPSARAAVEYLGVGSVSSLPRLYAESAVTVMPSIEEPFGMVVIESLASGTPVVCSSQGGPGEILSDDRLGTTIDLRVLDDVMGEDRVLELADAVVRTIELARDPQTARRCREHALKWRLERVGDLAQDLYREMSEQRRPARLAAGQPEVRPQ